MSKRKAAADYIATLAQGLMEIAKRSGLTELAFILDIAALQAAIDAGAQGDGDA